jgi:hypothetical protein
METESQLVKDNIPSADIVDESKRNKTSFYCKLCRSLVMRPNNATLVEKDVRHEIC